MGNMTIRKMDDVETRDLRISAAKRGSMEQDARQRLRRPLAASGPEVGTEGEWRPNASLAELLALGIPPERPIDHKAESDALYNDMDNDFVHTDIQPALRPA